MSGLRTGWIFLTRVPVGDDPHPDIARAVPWFPVVGTIVGAIAAGLWAAGSELMAPLPSAALAVSGAALVTGAFHHDGLADMADAFGGGWTREQRLEILKDSRHGTYGVMALVCIVALQIGALSSLGQAQGAAALVAAHTLGRAGAVGMLLWAPAAHGTGLGADWSKRVRAAPAGLGMVVALALATGALGWWAFAAAACVAVAVVACAVLAMRKIGGVTGDVLGAAEQLGETSTLLFAAVLVHRGAAFPFWT